VDHRLYFAVGDLLANIAIGAIVGVICWAIVSPSWNMWIAMFAMMPVGTVVGLILFFPIGIKLGAMEVMSGYLVKNYSEGGAKLLRQPGIVGFLNTRLDKLGEKAQADPSVAAVRKRMGEIEKLTTFPLDKAPSADDVKQLNTLTSDTVKEITKKQTK